MTPKHEDQGSVQFGEQRHVKLPDVRRSVKTVGDFTIAWVGAVVMLP